MKPSEAKIMQALTNNLEGLTFKELKENTKLSDPGLANCLTQLQSAGVILKDYKTRKYVLAAIYMPSANYANEWQKWMKVSTVALLREGKKISKMKQRTGRIEAFKNLMEIGFHHLTLVLWNIIGESLVDYENDLKKVNDSALADSRIARINDGVQNWVIGIADAVAVAMALNLDIYKEVADPIWRQKVAKLEQLIQTYSKA